MEIKKLELKDINKLQEVSKITFYNTFKEDDNKEDMDKYLKKAFSLDKINSELKNPNIDFFFIIFKNEVAGYLKLNTEEAQSEPEGSKALEIERIYILPEFKRLGLGTTLINYAINKANDLNKELIWLGVWEHNKPALKFYKKMGFKEFSEHAFQFGNERQRDILMKKNLK